jgi:hypothetical protein
MTYYVNDVHGSPIALASNLQAAGVAKTELLKGNMPESLVIKLPDRIFR